MKTGNGVFSYLTLSKSQKMVFFSLRPMELVLYSKYQRDI